MTVIDRPMEWALGNVDEAVFAFGTFLLELKHKTPYVSDAAELERWRGTTLPLEQIFLPPTVPQFELRPTRLPVTTIQLDGSDRHYKTWHIEYPSAVTTGYSRNDRVKGFYLERADGQPAPVLIYLHGWMEFEPGLSLRLPMSWVGPLGYNILALQMPFHFERTPVGTVSGELAITGNLPLGILGMQQAVSDVRQAIYWLKERHQFVGLMGKSLGGLVGAMTLATESQLAAGVLAVPATSSRASIWHSRYTRLIRHDLIEQGLDEIATAELLDVLRPGRFKPAIDPPRILILKAKADRVCFANDTDLLANAWNVPIIQVPTGHLTATLDPRVRRAAQNHLRQFLKSP